MPQCIARSVAADVLKRSSDFVRAQESQLHDKIASSVNYASGTWMGATGLRVGNMGLNIVDGIINFGMSTAAFKRVDALGVLPSASSFAVAQEKVFTTVSAVKKGTARRVGTATTTVRRRITAAK
ncbi:hypothetical protein T484DRAFT_1741993 [Baffinella frigidus]|nr:hypothetical protein T484DRAFT_1741993 [Cryptophyta sp. CCMP2293]